MSQPISTPPLSNIQLELLKLYATGVSDDTLVELKKTLAKFFLDKMRQSADKTWDEEGYTDTQMQAID